ncbi:hypothetical protein DLM85_11925 [Hymenobacter edaphi]|uniref:Secretion system C-terminal sorting domain-containing protein n=1 Tax=Hymenobacter edaphi TaxID=2211146 RepID=A0A328BJV6_9BACT|nr:hypothetical protein DLM85_11925 [Hymenobacter edaphi]
MLLAGLLPLSPDVRAQSGPAWARPIGGARVATGGTDYVYTVDNGNVVAFTAQGRQRWTQPMTGGINAMAADAAGNLWVTGNSLNGLSTGGLTLPSGGFVVKYGPQGNVVWGRAIGAIQGLYPAGRSIALGSGGEVYVAAVGGQFPNVAGANTFLQKYSAAGTPEWTQLAAGADATAVTADANGNVWLGGSFHTTARFGSIQLARAWRNGFLARYSAQGQVQWAKIFAAPGPNVPYVSSDIPSVRGLRAHGNAVYLACGLSDTVDFEGTRVVAPNRSSHGVLIRYDAQGNQQWLRQLVGTSVFISGLGVDASGNAVVGGSFLGSLSADQLSTTAPSLVSDLYVARYSPQGSAQWLRHERLAANQGMNDVTTDAAGNVYATGFSTGSGGTIALGDTLLPAGTVFLVRFGSSVLSTKAAAAFGPLSLYPHPSRPGAAPQLNWARPAVAGTKLVVLNALGQVLRTQPVSVGSSSAVVATAGLAPGSYLLQLRGVGGVQVCRLVLE